METLSVLRLAVADVVGLVVVRVLDLMGVVVFGLVVVRVLDLLARTVFGLVVADAVGLVVVGVLDLLAVVVLGFSVIDVVLGLVAASVLDLLAAVVLGFAVVDFVLGLMAVGVLDLLAGIVLGSAVADVLGVVAVEAFGLLTCARVAGTPDFDLVDCLVLVEDTGFEVGGFGLGVLDCFGLLLASALGFAVVVLELVFALFTVLTAVDSFPLKMARLGLDSDFNPVG